MLAKWNVLKSDSGGDTSAVDKSRSMVVVAGRWLATSVRHRAALLTWKSALLLVAFFLLPWSETSADTGIGDVEGGSHERAIGALAASGITPGCATDPDRHCPTRDTNSAQTASFLAWAPEVGLNSDWPNQWDLQMCRPRGVSVGTTAGFPLPGWAAPSLGILRVAVLFGDFPNAEATHTTYREAELGLPAIEKYLETFSYGKMDLRFTPLHGWLRAEQDYEHYSQESRHIAARINEEAVRLADPEFDFAGYHAVMIVMPSTHFSYAAAGGRANTEEGTLLATQINAFPLQESRGPARWGFFGAHELMHNLGLPDLYPTENAVGQPSREPPGKVWVRATFDIMRMWAVFPIQKERQSPFLFSSHSQWFKHHDRRRDVGMESLAAWVAGCHSDPMLE